ncbi:MAG: ZIP family metal transporter [Halieaceae bacterium]|nr:ZIP family metal transporter [Halieaceae bacterium]
MAASTILLLAYCLAIALFSLGGGLLPNWVKMTHTHTQFAMSLVSGLMLGVAFYHLLPHSVALIGGPAGVDAAVWWLMIGLIVMLLLLRMFHFHQHDFSNAKHGHENRDHHHEQTAHRFSWLGIALGLGLHTIIDGLALGAVIKGETATTEATGLLGLGVFLAILFHKPLDAMSITTLMEVGGWSRTSRAIANIVFALMCPLGALLFFYGVGSLEGDSHFIIGAALAFSAGAFICIALSDLLPEVQFHSHDRAKLTLAFLAGITMAYAIGHLEPTGTHLADLSLNGVQLWSGV